ncbi:hypothetical protein [Chitinophaga sp.]|uniref:hypothetical protein n=1 Tax=Chitinophaga sp. TaxID=1869181 RepID=UPI0031D033FE
MVEKIQVNNQDVWLLIEPRDAQHGDPNVIPTEYFIVSYALKEPAGVHETGTIFQDTNGEPRHFYSPVEAVEYAVEKLPVILG